MARIEMKGMEIFLRQLDDLEKNTTSFCKAVVYVGAAILADEMRAAVNALPTMTDGAAKAHWRAGAVMPMISVSQKAGLQASLGISEISKDERGMVQASVGFFGYNEVITDEFPNGQPNVVVARSLEKGTVALVRDAFASRAVRAARRSAIAAMAAEADAQIENIMDKAGG